MSRPSCPLLAAALATALLAGCSKTPVPTPPSPADSPAGPAPADVSAFELQDGFQPLTLADFDAFHADPSTWAAGEGNILRCSGSPKGYLYTRRPFRNFTLLVEYRFPDARPVADGGTYEGNTGFMVFITGEHKQWPVSLEVQGKYPEMATIKANGGAENPPIEDSEEQRLVARKPAGEWNRIEIVARDGALQASINGSLVCSSAPTALQDGHFGLQSEGYEVEFRNLQIRED